MKAIVISLVGAAILTAAAAAQVGSFFLGAFVSGRDKYGEFRTLVGAVDLPKGVPADELEIELRAGNRIIVTWSPVKGQDSMNLKFTISKEQAADSRLVIIRTKKDGKDTNETIETLDLAEKAFALHPPSKEAEQGGGGQPATRPESK
jgi:hypothetical protein